MSSSAAQLCDALVAVIGPVDGVSIGRLDDKSTWRVDFKDGMSFRYGSPPTDQREQDVAAVIAAFDNVAAASRRLVPKSLIISRLTDPQLDAALAAMTPRQKERWRAPDKPAIYSDDPEIVGLIEAIGADPAVVMAPEMKSP